MPDTKQAAQRCNNILGLSKGGVPAVKHSMDGIRGSVDRLYQTLNQSEASEMLKCRQQMIDIYLLPLDAADATAQGGGRLHPQMAIAIHLHVFAMVAVLGLAACYHRAVAVLMMEAGRDEVAACTE